MTRPSSVGVGDLAVDPAYVPVGLRRVIDEHLGRLACGRWCEHLAGPLATFAAAQVAATEDVDSPVVRDETVTLCSWHVHATEDERSAVVHVLGRWRMRTLSPLSGPTDDVVGSWWQLWGSSDDGWHLVDRTRQDRRWESGVSCPHLTTPQRRPLGVEVQPQWRVDRSDGTFTVYVAQTAPRSGAPRRRVSARRIGDRALPACRTVVEALQLVPPRCSLTYRTGTLLRRQAAVLVPTDVPAGHPALGWCSLAAAERSVPPLLRALGDPPAAVSG